jgi:hypothetical protein
MVSGLGADERRRSNGRAPVPSTTAATSAPQEEPTMFDDRRSRALVTAAIGGLVLAGGGIAEARPEPATVTATWACDSMVTVTATRHAISNVVVVDADGHERFVDPFDDAVKVFTWTFDADDHPGLAGVYVKAGSNSSSAGPGYGQFVPLTAPDCDVDGDGHPVSADCDDSDPTVFPSAPEVPNDGIDQDCDGADLVVGDGDIRVTLQWGTEPAADMDLYVIDPNGERVNFRNPGGDRDFDGGVASGGELDFDDICDQDGDGQSIENVFWDEAEAIPGTYIVGVDHYLSSCSTGENEVAVPWHLEIHVDGLLVQTHEGFGDSDPADLQAGPENTFTFTYPA